MDKELFGLYTKAYAIEPNFNTSTAENLAFSGINFQKSALVKQLEILKEAANFFCKGASTSNIRTDIFVIQSDKKLKIPRGSTIKFYNMISPFNGKTFTYKELEVEIRKLKAQIKELDRKSTEAFNTMQKTRKSPLEKVNATISFLEERLDALKKIKEKLAES